MLRFKPLHDLTADATTAERHAGNLLTIGQRPVLRAEAFDAFSASLSALPRQVSTTRRFPLGLYRGLRFGLVLHPQFHPDVYLEGATTRHSMLAREHQGPRAVLNALERLADSYGSEGDRVRQDLGIAQGQLRDYQARLGLPFIHEAYLSRLTTLRDQLKAGLSAAAPEPGSPALPPVAELAAQIKTLQAGHRIDAAPERAVKRHVSAEEPVTTRLHRRLEAMPAADASQPEVAAPAGTSLPPESMALPSARRLAETTGSSLGR